MNKKMNNKGFSLVELIIVIAIMAILVGVLAPQFIKYVERSKISKDMQNAQVIKEAIDAYIAGEQLTSGTVTVTVTGGTGGTIAVSVPDISKVDGVSASTPLASDHWASGAQTYTFNFTGTNAFKWTGASKTNDSDTSKDMYDVFK